MEKTHVVFDPAYTIAQVDPRIFRGFLEHMGRAVYEGVYDPKSCHADENGFRRDTGARYGRLKYDCYALPGRKFCFWISLDGRDWSRING